MKKILYFILGLSMFVLMGTQFRPIQSELALGHIKGLVCGWSDANTITISAGSAEVNGTYYEQTSATTFDIDTGADTQLVYIFIDDSASTRSSIVFRDEDNAVETPAWSDAKQGWYSDQTVADRRIATIYCNGAATMTQFIAYEKNNNFIQNSFYDRTIELASDMNPDSTYQEPDVANGSDFLDSGCTAMFVQLYNIDADDRVEVACANAEGAVINSTYSQSAYGQQSTTSVYNYLNIWIPLSTSLDIKIAGQGDDDNLMDCFCRGFEFHR